MDFRYLPGPVEVLALAFWRLLISCRTNARSAMSIANAIKVRKAAKKDNNDETSATATFSENEQAKAKKVNAVAVGFT